MAKKSLAAIDADIAFIQRQLNALTDERNQAVAVLNSALLQRPSGIPSTWLPTFDDRGGIAIVTAWFDPAKYGSDFRQC